MSSEPMIKLEPDGRAPILSYNLPDATSYAGRHYIELELAPEDFLEEIADADARVRPSLLRPAGSGAVTGLADDEATGTLVTGDDVLVLGEAADGSLLLRTSLPVSDNLAALTPAALRALLRDGRDVTIAPNLAGNLDYRVSSQAMKGDGGAGAADDPPVSSGNAATPKMFLTIDSPAKGAVLTGPSSGLAVTVEGGAEMLTGLGHVGKVEIRLDGGAWQVATRPAGATDWGAWSATLTLATSGLHLIEAKGTHSALASADDTASVSLRASLTGPATASGDATPPTLAITQPLDGTTIVKADGKVSLQLRGSAQDAGGVASVTVAVDAGSPTAANPKAGGDWSAWTADVAITGAGAHVLSASCRDVAGNEQRQSVRVMLAAAEPRVLERSRLMLVESYRLSSFLGRYGAGRTIKTFSLLPGERTKISVRTYRRSEETAKQASSILDSLTDASSTEFTNSLAAEQSNKQSHGDSFNYQLSANVEQSWGSGRAEVSGGVAGGANAAREEFGKTVANVTSKHAAQASAKRDVQVNNDFTSKVEQGEETSTEREIQNINVGRTLNFVFRQMNQEFVSVLHLVDVRLGLARIYRLGDGWEIDYREVRLPEMKSLIAQTIVPRRRQATFDTVIGLLENVADYRDELFDVIEHVVPNKAGQPVPEAGYSRFDRRLKQTYVDRVSGSSWEVPGIIAAVTTNVLRTEGVVVDALLGQGEGLDDYSRGLQEAAVRERALRNEGLEREIADRELVAGIVVARDAIAADVYETVHPATPSSFALNVGDNHDGSAPTP